MIIINFAGDTNPELLKIEIEAALGREVGGNNSKPGEWVAITGVGEGDRTVVELVLNAHDPTATTAAQDAAEQAATDTEAAAADVDALNLRADMLIIAADPNLAPATKRALGRIALGVGRLARLQGRTPIEITQEDIDNINGS